MPRFKVNDKVVHAATQRHGRIVEVMEAHRDRLLLVSLFPDSVRMYSATNAQTANRYILSLASEAVFASIAPGSSTEELYNSCKLAKKIL